MNIIKEIEDFFRDMLIFFKAFFRLWLNGKPYRQESSRKARALYKTYLIDRWFYADRSFDNFIYQLECFKLEQDEYIKDFSYRLTKDRNIKKQVQIMFKIAGLSENGQEISIGKRKKVIIESLVSLIIFTIVIAAILSIIF